MGEREKERERERDGNVMSGGVVDEAGLTEKQSDFSLSLPVLLGLKQRGGLHFQVAILANGFVIIGVVPKLKKNLKKN